jgi:hypothetical protein
MGVRRDASRDEFSGRFAQLTYRDLFPSSDVTLCDTTLEVVMRDPNLPPQPIAQSPEPRSPLPWEDPSVGRLTALYETVRLFVSQPRDGFSRMSAVGIGRPFGYAVIMAWIEAAVGFAYLSLFQTPFFLAGFPELRREFAGAAIGSGMMVLIAVAVFIMLPVLVAIGLFIHTCILHLMLLILGEGRGGFETTFRVLCYSHTADVANVIPLCGGLISLIWFVILQTLGVAEGHRCSQGKAALAVLLPLLLCCACVAVLLSAGIGTAILSGLSDW